ncbi:MULTISPECIES: hypothetical protein [Streptomyces]|uniref:hypothetical protein n=1 Tax=Streptomyces TaxID=1883 RepID=UPI000E6773FC|nr:MULTISPECIES: hypothetical protein [Streptomyces]MDX3069832.1 hypothetical protein [Streptomyces sp. ND04-05B]MDX3519439.1 hypothetical protein [Streptomyces scabiei]
MAREAEYVARFTHNGRTHDIQPGWSYDNINNARTKCAMKGPFAIESLASGRLLDVTCTPCAAAD